MKKTPIWALAITGTFLVLGTPATAQKSAKSQTPINDTVSSVDKRFIMKAAEGNMAEVMMSELALKKSPTKAVRETAWMIAQHHREAQNRLRGVAQSAGVSLPSRPNAMQRAAYQRLSRLSGATFDREYLRVQAKAHLDAINLYNMENRSGRDHEAVVYARETLPIIQHHTSEVTQVADNLGVRIPGPAQEYAKERGSVSAGRETSSDAKNRGKAMGHDKNKAKGNATGHDKGNH